jgi:hypothetical protein
MTERLQREAKLEIKEEEEFEFIDESFNLNGGSNPEIEAENFVEIKHEPPEDDDDEDIPLAFIDAAKIQNNENSTDESLSDESSNESDDEGSMSDSNSEEMEKRKAPSQNIQQTETEEGVVRTVVDNVEFITRKPGCLVMVEKKKAQPEAIRNNQKPENWIRIRQRTARARGEEYVSRQGKVIRARILQPPCDSKCRFKCYKKLTEADRQKSFDSYWQLGDFIKQRKYLYEHSKAEPVARRRGRSEHGIKRKFSLKFFLDVHRLDGPVKEQIKVCAKMFVNT